MPELAKAVDQKLVQKTRRHQDVRSTCDISIIAIAVLWLVQKDTRSPKWHQDSLAFVGGPTTGAFIYGPARNFVLRKGQPQSIGCQNQNECFALRTRIHSNYTEGPKKWTSIQILFFTGAMDLVSGANRRRRHFFH